MQTIENDKIIPKKPQRSLVITNFSEEYIERALEIMIPTYQTENPLVSAIKVSDEEVRQILLPTLTNKKLYEFSVAVVDKDTGILLSCNFITDAADIPKPQDRVFHPNPKIALKQQCSYELIDQYFKDLKYMKGIKKIDDSIDSYLGNILPRQVAFSSRTCVDKNIQKLGLAKLQSVEILKNIITAGYKYVMGTVANTAMGKISEHLQGQAVAHIQISNKHVNGEFLFKHLDYGMRLYIHDLQSPTLRAMVFGKPRPKKQQQQQQNTDISELKKGFL